MQPKIKNNRHMVAFLHISVHPGQKLTGTLEWRQLSAIEVIVNNIVRTVRVVMIEMQVKLFSKIQLSLNMAVYISG